MRREERERERMEERERERERERDRERERERNFVNLFLIDTSNENTVCINRHGTAT